jgi:hypothetical protein
MTAYEQLETVGTRLEAADAALRGVVKYLERNGERDAALPVVFAIDRICDAKRALGWPS